MKISDIIKLPLKVLNRVRFAFVRTSECATIRESWPGTFFFFLFKPGTLSSRKCAFHLGAVRFNARLIDWFAIEEVALRGEYDCANVLLNGREQPTILDLGANIGMFSIYCFRARPKAIIHSVEASTATFAVLDGNKDLNPQLNWKTYRGAVWSTDGFISFADNAEASTGSRISEDSKTKVESLALSGLIKRVGGAIDILKMDIEGAEEEAICAPGVDLSGVANLIIEIHPDRCSEPRVMSVIRANFSHIYKVGGRQSSKPVLVATRAAISSPSLQLIT